MVEMGAGTHTTVITHVDTIGQVTTLCNCTHSVQCGGGDMGCQGGATLPVFQVTTKHPVQCLSTICTINTNYLLLPMRKLRQSFVN